MTLPAKECPQCGNTITQPSDHDWSCDFHPDSLEHSRKHGS